MPLLSKEIYAPDGNRYLLDTNAIIALLQSNNKLAQQIQNAEWIGISIINQIEFLAFSDLSEKDLQLFCQYFVYVVYKIKTNLDYIYQDYRKRFGIETSYRLKNICRIRTNNKNPTLRLLFIGISFLLVNIWVNLLWRRISRKRKGSRLIYRTLFTLKQMLAFLSQAIERKYQVVEIIYIPTG